MRKQPDTLGIALDAREKDIVAIPCHPGTKIPAVRWKVWQTMMPPEELQRQWFREPCNVAIVTSGMVVFDCDDPDLAEWVLAECGDTPHQVKTPRGGVHLGYRARRGVALGNQVKVKGLDLDIRTFGGIEVIPDSWTPDGEYAWLLGSGLRPVAELPLARISWTRERKRPSAVPEIVVSAETRMDRQRLIIRARAWAACVEGAVSGHRGHDKTFRLCCRLTHFKENCFGLSFEEAWPILLEWNQTCDPPWSEPELVHKLEDAIKKR
jgi:hypothetical protein